MQYVRSISGSVSKTWNSINPATLSGAIDVIVIEQEDGSLACSPFHVRFGKFSLLRPYEKKVEFKVNNVKQNYAMKLGEEGEAFFVFETSDEIPEALQTSPLVSPATSPQGLPAQDPASLAALQEPDYLDLTTEGSKGRSNNSYVSGTGGSPGLPAGRRAQSFIGSNTPLSVSPDGNYNSSVLDDWTDASTQPRAALERSASEELLPLAARAQMTALQNLKRSALTDRMSEPPPTFGSALSTPPDPSNSPPPLPASEAVNRAKSLSKKLSSSNIPTHVNDSGDLMLDMTGYKSSEDEALRAEVIARKILAEELEGNYDIGALIGADEHRNLWIYSSEEAKEAAGRKAGLQGLATGGFLGDAASDPGYQSDEEQSTTGVPVPGKHERRQSDVRPRALVTPPQTPPDHQSASDVNRTYAKTLRLTSDQLKALKLKAGANLMSFTVNRATCQAYMYYWTYDVPIVISDIDGTITKSDALGHVLNMIGRDWTHIGVAKLYTDIVANGYNILYLTSRSVGQADTTRAYLNGVSQEGHKLPRGPVIMSPDRTVAALRREIYLRKPEVFKMACLRDILNLFGRKANPFYAGFGNRLTDALSYRSVNIPSTRIFTINSNAEVSLDLLTLNKYKSSYVTMREVVDHFFPPVGLLVMGGGEEFTDFNYWRSAPLDIDEFSASDSEDDSTRNRDRRSVRSEDEGSEGLDDEEQEDDLEESYLSRESIEEGEDLINSIIESIEDGDLVGDDVLEDEGGIPLGRISTDPNNPREAEIILVDAPRGTPNTEHQPNIAPDSERRDFATFH
ncbi:Lipin, N-terminal [Lasallia pustulata]|uniref:Lipin, N-terminal n=1 Tax=Lasallia pustulata TaxID=136370 RepID=A0A1W5D4U8_9LECA|nr:Lipin, N-terminal [Lasallia pustulata]